MAHCPKCQNLVAADAHACNRCGQLVDHQQQADVDEPPPVDDLTGQTFGGGRYLLAAQLGVGGMGAVYRATDIRLHRDVALKVLHAELVAHPTARRRMTQEARALARIEHPNVVRVIDVFDEGQMLVMVLEFVTGGDLSGEVQPGGMAEALVVPLMVGVLAGLEAVHQAGLVHRDMKPGNVLLTDKGVPKITDLGVARDAQAKDRTQLGAKLGTPEYMSPEQVQGLGIDARCDIYAAGIVLYELLTGEKPYDATTDFDIASAHVREPPNLARLQGKASPGVVAVITKALAKAPAERFGSAAEMGAALLSGPAKMPVRHAAAAPTNNPSAGAQPDRSSTRKPSLIVWAGVCGGIAVLATMAVLNGGGVVSDPAQEPAPALPPSPQGNVILAGGAGAAPPESEVAALEPEVASPPVVVDNLALAKGMIDKIAGVMEKMVVEIEAAGADQAKVKEIGDKFKASAEGMKTEGEELNKKLSDDEKKQLESYGKEKMAPLMGKLMGAMMKAQAAGQPAPAAH